MAAARASRSASYSGKASSWPSGPGMNNLSGFVPPPSGVPIIVPASRHRYRRLLECIDLEPPRESIAVAHAIPHKRSV